MTKTAPKPRVALTVSGGRCNVGMPNNVFDRFVWAVQLYAQAGFKVVIDNHGGWPGAHRVWVGPGGVRLGWVDGQEESAFVRVGWVA